ARQLSDNTKTCRGVVAVALGTAVGVGFQIALHWRGVARGWELLDYGSATVVGLGLAMGAAAMLAELPNSFLKRQLGIGPGAAAGGVRGGVVYLLEQGDMLYRQSGV